MDNMEEQKDTTTRREVLRSAALVGGGGVAGYGAASVKTNGTACDEPLPSAVREMDGDTEFWLGDDDELQSRPMYTLSLPGTHHASFYEMTDNWLSADFLSRGHVERWTKPQSRDVRTQLEDGIRYLDVRPFYDAEAAADGGRRFWGHHEVARGAPLDDVFGDIADFLAEADASTDGNEIVFVKLSHIDGFDTKESREGFADFLRSHLGEYAFELPAEEPSELLSRPLSSFDGSRVGVLYEGENPWEGVADSRERWLRDGWVNKPTVGDAHRAAVGLTHTDASRLGETGYYVTPTEGRIALAVLTGWLPFSGAWLGYSGLREAASEMSRLFPCYLNHALADDSVNPNVLTVDYYHETAVVDACRYLSRRGLHRPHP